MASATMFQATGQTQSFHLELLKRYRVFCAGQSGDTLRATYSGQPTRCCMFLLGLLRGGGLVQGSASSIRFDGTSEQGILVWDAYHYSSINDGATIHKNTD